MASITFKKIVKDLSSKEGVKNLLGDFKKLSAELKTKANTQINLQDSKAVLQAKAKYKDIVHTLNNSQAKIDNEVNKALDLIRKSAAEVEKNIITYKKAAMAQKVKLEKTLKAKTSKKKAPPKTTKKKSVKTAPAGTKRTSTKVTAASQQKKTSRVAKVKTDL